jgi:hypothetical protein
MRRPSLHTVALLLALVPLLFGVVALLYGWLIGVMQCDEICHANSGNWRETSDAWQWYAILAGGIATCALAIALFVCVVNRRPGRALVCLVLGTATTAAPLALLAASTPAVGETPEDPGIGFYVLLAAVFAAALLASLLAGAKNMSQGQSLGHASRARRG